MSWIVYGPQVGVEEFLLKKLTLKEIEKVIQRFSTSS